MSDRELRELDRLASAGDAQAGRRADNIRARLGLPPRWVGSSESIDERLDTYDWEIVFGVEGAFMSHGETTTKQPDVVPPGGSPVSPLPFTREDIAEVIHIWEASGREYADWNGVVVARLYDGRYASAFGWSDSSGWG